MKNQNKLLSKLLIVLLMLVMALSMSACKKKGNTETAESGVVVSEAGETSESSETSEAGETETIGTETAEKKETEETEWTGGITEEDGELIIEVPDGEDTAGE